MSKDEQIRCQSCGQPISLEWGNLGTLKDGGFSHDYCSICYENGEFTQPEMTVDGMIQISIEHMAKQLNMPLEQATELANSFIPTLSRWNV